MRGRSRELNRLLGEIYRVRCVERERRSPMIEGAEVNTGTSVRGQATGTPGGVIKSRSASTFCETENPSNQAGTQVENEPAAHKGKRELTPILCSFAAPAGLRTNPKRQMSDISDKCPINVRYLAGYTLDTSGVSGAQPC